MAYRGKHYKGSIVHRFGGYDKPEICATCVRWSNNGGCSVERSHSPADRCKLFQFAKYANYRLDGHGGVEYNDEYLAYLERRRAKKPKVSISYIEKSEVPKANAAIEADEEADAVYADEFEVLENAGIEYVDKRPMGGALWVIGGKELENTVQGMSEFGLNFTFKSTGGKATGGRPAWWSK